MSRSRLPLELSTPPLPPGTVTVSDDDGTSGAVATKAKVVGVTSCHVPATGGMRVGVGDSTLRGSVKRTSMGESLGTWVAPATGVTDCTRKATLLAASGLEVGEAAARPVDPRRRTTPATPPTTMTSTATGRTNVNIRRPDPMVFPCE